MDLILKFILTNIGLYLAKIINFVTSPILKVLNKLIPDFSTYMVSVNSFLTTYLFKGVQFFKMMFLNLTNINHDVFDLFVLSFLVVINLSAIFVIFKLVYNLWQIYTGNKKGDS